MYLIDPKSWNYTVSALKKLKLYSSCKNTQIKRRPINNQSRGSINHWCIIWVLEGSDSSSVWFLKGSVTGRTSVHWPTGSTRRRRDTPNSRRFAGLAYFYFFCIHLLWPAWINTNIESLSCLLSHQHSMDFLLFQFGLCTFKYDQATSKWVMAAWKEATPWIEWKLVYWGECESTVVLQVQVLLECRRSYLH